MRFLAEVVIPVNGSDPFAKAEAACLRQAWKRVYGVLVGIRDDAKL